MCKFFSSVEVQSVNSSNGTDATWEDNWLFKKRKLKTENQSIAMLVPSPTEEIKALIGDKNADETSDLSENSDTEDDVNMNKTYTNTLLIEPKSQTVPVAQISAVNSNAPDSLKSMISLDTENPAIVTEAKNNHLLIDDVSEAPTTPEPAHKINFIISGPVTVGEKPLSELSVDVEKQTAEEEEFDSMVSPTQVREHKKSIDEQFEKLLMDDNNNSPLNVSDVFKTSSVESTPTASKPDEKESMTNNGE